MADGILTPCNVARSWHWFRQVTAPCNVACGSGIVTKWQHTAMWYVALGWHAIEFARWQYPAMWHIALESWHWIRQVAALYSVAGDSGMTCLWIRPNVRHIGILHLFSITSPQSTCCSAPVSEILSKSDHPRQKKWRHVDFQDGGSQPSWILGGPIMGSLKIPII